MEKTFFLSLFFFVICSDAIGHFGLRIYRIECWHGICALFKLIFNSYLYASKMRAYKPQQFHFVARFTFSFWVTEYKEENQWSLQRLDVLKVAWNTSNINYPTWLCQEKRKKYHFVVMVLFLYISLFHSHGRSISWTKVVIHYDKRGNIILKWTMLAILRQCETILELFKILKNTNEMIFEKL